MKLQDNISIRNIIVAKFQGPNNMGHNARKCPFRQNFNFQRNKHDSIEKCFQSIIVFI